MAQSFNWHKEAEKQWNERAELWNAKSREMWENGSRSTIIPFLKKYIADGKVADLGCGDGYGSFLLYKEGFEVTGLDLSQDMVSRANERMNDERISFVQGDLTNLPFEDETYDAVMAINSLEWTEIPYKGLEEMKRVLHPGGRLCIGLLGPTAMPRINSFRRVYGEEVICNTMMPWELQKMAEETGWIYIDGQGVYKRGIEEEQVADLDEQLKQALTFMWIFIFEKQA
ncbi:Methyltransferase domain-containing protein [Halobacillus karajensis]|uniref:Demethylrebeccamycin-D-glucose O-methyltransferase n=1 Tax=Halobacillus karajensis TaxID=195088 RepID=A0A024P8N5_9BACI|nr:class I SAM-dependent methyltransferase [Halobacillus karajensis]CDQ21565.1 Demethylrebeccamycin-D-glucose O-methyltransferase [Halobacillus karajensis]CDQ25499.1 Demethylrebeccamycin-D-glucose O-methyltransferase [Halobacillus karajensis]CDQ28970.1 Demethylrebeccamycin-D-glucose O-methyltransferase [Halobacillus karajensis]SEI08909.1 Methyltransferase domain-containing protein [Halobacillus karajensis]